MANRYLRRAAALSAGQVGRPDATPIYLNSTSSTLKYVPASSGSTEVEIADVSAVQSFSNKTLASGVLTGDAGTGVIFSKTVLFTEDATSVTHTGTVVIPAGATLIDIIVTPQVLWTASTSAAFTCGDANSANGWFTTTNLKATDLLLGETLVASSSTNWGGVNGTYLVSATGRFGQQSTTMIGGFCPTAYSVIGVVTVVGPSTTAGRLRMTVLWSVGQAIVPVLA